VREIGILSKLKDTFSTKTIESLKEYEIEISKFQKKLNAEMIALIGIGGRIKGLPLIFATSDENELKKISARVYEIIDPLQNITIEHIIRDFIVNYENSTLFFKPFMKNVGFAAIIKNKNDLSANVKNRNDLIALNKWISKNEKILKDLFHENA